jgi:hypothetical protein
VSCSSQPVQCDACDRAVPCGFDFGAQRCSERTAALSGSWEKLAEQRASEVGQLATSAPGLASTSSPGLANTSAPGVTNPHRLRNRRAHRLRRRARCRRAARSCRSGSTGARRECHMTLQADVICCFGMTSCAPSARWDAQAAERVLRPVEEVAGGDQGGDPSRAAR